MVHTPILLADALYGWEDAQRIARTNIHNITHQEHPWRWTMNPGTQDMFACGTLDETIQLTDPEGREWFVYTDESGIWLVRSDDTWCTTHDQWRSVCDNLKLHTGEA